MEEEIYKDQESRTEGQETIQEDIIYELPESPDGGEGSNADNADNVDNDDNSDNADNSENAENKLRRMIEEVGAETLLEIIRDNRNAAIRQIISEVEASQDHALQSGVSAARACNSIFDLAALA